MGRGWYLSAGHALIQGSLPVTVLDLLWIRRQEWRPVVIQETVQHQSQGVNICRVSILLPLVHLRCHIIIRALPGHGRDGLLRNASHPEVSQLEVPVLGHEDILRLDVPVKDTALAAKLQCLGQIQPQAHHIKFPQGVTDDVVGQGREQFHADQDIPAHLSLMLNHHMILVADDIAVPLHLGHKGKFCHNVLHKPTEIFRDTLLVHPFRIGSPDIPLGSRNGNYLQRRLIGLAELLPLYPVYFSKTAFP